MVHSLTGTCQHTLCLSSALKTLPIRCTLELQSIPTRWKNHFVTQTWWHGILEVQAGVMGIQVHLSQSLKLLLYEITILSIILILRNSQTVFIREIPNAFLNLQAGKNAHFNRVNTFLQRLQKCRIIIKNKLIIDN